ncbi:hypothetical protein CD798_15560 [Bacillaceae bacterium SAOS 7]|nr:hypothetical protein CD798_15560 [Bacillaceae bacterium SAOS 7]
MYSWQLLLDRIKRNGRSKYKMWKSILDWTVLLYIAMPAMVAGGIIYRSWWIEIPEWSDQFNFFFLNFLVYTFCWFGQNRTYVQEADGLFLLKHRQKFIRMKQWALAYSVGQAVLKSLLLTLVLLPFLLFHFSLVTSEIVGFLLLLIGGDCLHYGDSNGVLFERRGLEAKDLSSPCFSRVAVWSFIDFSCDYLSTALFDCRSDFVHRRGFGVFIAKSEDNNLFSRGS